MLPETGVFFSTDHALLAKLMASAEEKCLRNVRRFGDRNVLVEGGGYDKIWLETQPMGGEMYAKRDLITGWNNQRLFMDYQRADGRIPGSIALIDGAVTPQFDKFQGFCFPAPALDMYFLTGRDGDYLLQLYEVLRRFDEYLWRVRDSDGDGCLESWCRYDTGEDHARRYGDAPDPWEKETPPEGCDTVPIASMDIMSFSVSARQTMAEIADILGRGETAEQHRKEAGIVTARMREYLWDDRRGALFDRDRHHRVMPVLLHNTLRCMYWGSISREMADLFVREHLLNPREFWTKLPLPSVAANDPLFVNEPSNDWSGQVEALTYQRAIRALENYGYFSLLPRLGWKLLEAIGEACRFVQQYDPFTMEPSGVAPDGAAGQDAYGPAMLSVMEYVSRMFGVHICRGRLIWGSCRGIDAEYEQKWNGRSYRMENHGERAAAYIDGRQIFESGRGLRIETDPEGEITGVYGCEEAADCRVRAH
ncbi:MGH1-like glycoside hydrolase domain-containing protein [Lachnoclostridium sp. Marseille-P6806]|uniref:MGH1-like glycoside hydrolase domain-containing protein n=1 Tax=Lachnoclostridium sp. Marseille-P6806 TaxID=2364793 RepID=UPI0010303692|nr:trehalase family glycosidase [Lachnoclostridium sp. Marseille-P6806]